MTSPQLAKMMITSKERRKWGGSEFPPLMDRSTPSTDGSSEKAVLQREAGTVAGSTARVVFTAMEF